jgi:hypothetical protein
VWATRLPTKLVAGILGEAIGTWYCDLLASSSSEEIPEISHAIAVRASSLRLVFGGIGSPMVCGCWVGLFCCFVRVSGLNLIAYFLPGFKKLTGQVSFSINEKAKLLPDFKNKIQQTLYLTK